MHKKKPIGPGTWLALCAMLVILFAGSYFGLTARGSGLRVGYSDSFHGNAWQARYLLLTGFRERTVNISNEPAILHAEITTESGTVSLTVTDMDGNVIFFREAIPSTAFDINIPGKVTVRVTGTGHKGSFILSWDTQS